MSRAKLRRRLPRIAVNGLVIFAMVIWIVPTLGLFITSFRPASDVTSSGWWTVLSSPQVYPIYCGELQSSTVHRWHEHCLSQQLLVTIGGTVIPVFIAALAAFGLSKLHFGGRAFFYGLIVMMLVVPTQMTFIPVLRLYNALRLSGTFVGLWLVHTGYGLPFAVFMLHNFFEALPDDLFQAAYIDGASVWTTFVRLAVPLSVPAIAPW